MDTVVYNAINQLTNQLVTVSEDFVVDTNEVINAFDPVYVGNNGKLRNVLTSRINPFNKSLVSIGSASSNLTANLSGGCSQGGYATKRAVVIDPTRILSIAGSAGGAGLNVQILSVTNGVTTKGTEVQVSTTNVAYACVQLIDSTHALILYSTGVIVAARVITFSGTTITAIGTELTVATLSNACYLDICMMSSTQAVVSYSASTGCTLVVLTITGTTLALGILLTKGSAMSNLVYLDATHLLLTSSANNAYSAVSNIITVSGTTLTSGADQTISGNMGGPQMIKLDNSNSLFLCVGWSSGINACVVNANVTSANNAITKGPEVNVGSLSYSLTYLVLDGNRVMLIYGSSNSLFYTICKVDGENITSGPQITIPGSYNNPCILPIDRGFSILLAQSSASGADMYAVPLSDYELKGVFGVAMNAGIAGQTVDVLLCGQRDGLSGLTSGDVIASPDRVFGVCVSPTKMLVKPFWE